MCTKKKSSFFIYCFILLAIISSSSLFADRFRFKSDRMFSILAKGKERTVLTGNAVIVSGNTTIESDRIELYGDNFQYAVCSGKVKVKDEEKGIILKCGRLFFDRDEDILKARDGAVMEDQKNELVVKGGYLENHGKDEIVIIHIGVRILKKDLVCRSEFARYKRKEEKLELSGMPVVFKKNDEYRASRIVINLDNDEVSLEGSVSGTIISEDDEGSEDILPFEEEGLNSDEMPFSGEGDEK